MSKKITLTLCTTLLLSIVAQAAVLYTTIPSANTFNSTYSFGVAGPSSSWGELDVAAKFVAPNNTELVLDSVEIALRSYSVSAPMEVMLTADNAGNPGTVLAIAYFTAPNSSAIATADFNNTLTLTVGTAYWVRLSVQTTGQALWHESLPAVAGNCKHSSNSGASWSGYSTPLPAFRVNTIPEPATLFLLTLGGCILRKVRQ